MNQCKIPFVWAIIALCWLAGRGAGVSIGEKRREWALKWLALCAYICIYTIYYI